MWMIVLAISVSPLFAQEGEASKTTEEQQVEKAIEEALGEGTTTETVVFDGDEPEVIEQETEEPDVAAPVVTEQELTEQELEEQMVDEQMVDEQFADESPAEEKSRNRNEYRQVQTLMTGGGGYGALSVGYTEVNTLPALTIGAQAEWVVGHGFGIGIAGVGFTSDFTPVGSDYYALSGGYGGLIMEPIILGWFPVHISLPVVIGGGGLASYATNADPWNYDNINPTFGEYAWFFVAEVGAELEFNLVRFFRLSIYGNYRWTTDLVMTPMYGLDPNPVPEYQVGSHALDGWSAGVRFKFGSF